MNQHLKDFRAQRDGLQSAYDRKILEGADPKSDELRYLAQRIQGLNDGLIRDEANLEVEASPDDQLIAMRRRELEQCLVNEQAEVISKEISELTAEATTPQERIEILKTELEKVTAGEPQAAAPEAVEPELTGPTDETIEDGKPTIMDRLFR